MKKYSKIKHNGKYIPITSHPLFPIYHGIKNRCYNKKLPTYDRWGGRGIRMSKSWYNSFEKFVKDMGPRPSNNHSVDRIDNNKGYSKDNCKWATPKEQANNARSNIKIEYKGKIRSLSETAEFVNVSYQTFYHYFIVKGINDVDLIVNFLKHKEGRKITTKELKTIRQVQHFLQNETCPILKSHFSEKDMVVDHLHSKHANLLGLENSGNIRGIIHRQANSFEGKIANLMIRLGMHKFDLSLPELLRNCADYLEQPSLPYIHPSEAPKDPKLMKSSYNKLKKALEGTNYKCPHMSKSGKLTKPLQRAFEHCGITPEFYKK